ncbi:MAG: hypothetical protein ACKO04_11830, partial [Actinomycetes bacterium]
MLTRALIIAMVSAAVALLVPPYPASRVRSVTQGRGEHAWTPRVTRVVLKARIAVRGVGLGPVARRRRAQQRLRLIQSLGALAAELAAGQPPSVALVRCAG